MPERLTTIQRKALRREQAECARLGDEICLLIHSLHKKQVELSLARERIITIKAGGTK